MAFKFKLESLLNYNKRLEDIARINFAKAEARVNEVKADIAKMYGDIKNARVNISDISLKGGLISREIDLQDYLIKSLYIKIDRRKLQLQELLVDLEDKREALQKAMVEYKKIEKLRDKSFENYKIERKKRELKQLDDIMLMKFNKER